MGPCAPACVLQVLRPSSRGSRRCAPHTRWRPASGRPRRSSRRRQARGFPTDEANYRYQRLLRVRQDRRCHRPAHFKSIDKNVNDSDRIVVVNPVLQAFGKQRALPSIGPSMKRPIRSLCKSRRNHNSRINAGRGVFTQPAVLTDSGLFPRELKTANGTGQQRHSPARCRYCSRDWR
jgi:hypothetical protein